MGKVQAMGNKQQKPKYLEQQDLCLNLPGLSQLLSNRTVVWSFSKTSYKVINKHDDEDIATYQDT